MTESKNSKTFISYSWDDDDHKNWVAALATRLRGDGADVRLDQWHTVPGDQLPEFMEREIRENDYVLIVCTPNYKKKSDGRFGGVGYEGDIMTAEIYEKGNHRKFIPVLVRGSWSASAASWLTGKYYIDLSSPSKFEQGYQDIVTTILGTRPAAPPIGRKSKLQTSPLRQVSIPANANPEDPIRIIGIIVDEVSEPRQDGTEGSALYVVPFRLSREPSGLWSKLFVNIWDYPPSYTSMHRSGIARVIGDKVVLDGTTVEEVERYHRDTLLLCVKQTNVDEQRILKQQRLETEQKQKLLDLHKDRVNDVANRLKFD